MNALGRNLRSGGRAAKLDPALLLPVCAVWVVAIFAFWPARNFQFLYFDDDINIFLNPHLGGLDRHTVTWLLRDVYYMRRYIPAGWLGFSTLYGWFGLNPRGYHLINIIVHGVNAVLVFAICREVVGKFRPERASSPWLEVSAAMAALWWALHPLRVETVAWASGYLYVQSAFFFLVSFYLYIAHTDHVSPGRKRLVLSSACFTVSIASYPLMLGYPAALLCWEAVRLQRTTRVSGGEWWRQYRLQIRTVLGWFGIPAAVFGGMTIYASNHASAFWGQPASLESINLMDRLGRAVYGWGYYLWKPWWPFRPELVPASIHDPAWRESNFLLCATALMAMICLCFFIKASRRSGFWAVGAAYLAILVPMLGLTEKRHFESDRYSYLAMLPLVIAGAVGLAFCVQPVLRRALAVGSVCLLGGLLALTRRQIVPWQDSETFFARALEGFSAPEKEMEHIYIMSTNMFQITGRYGQAQAVCTAGLGKFPNSEKLAQRRREIEQAAAEAARAAEKLGLRAPVPELVLAHVAIAGDQSKHSEWTEAADHLRAALQAAPEYYPARFKLAEVLAMQEKPDEALACYLQALAEANGHMARAERAHFLFMLASVSAMKGRGRLAHIAFEKGQELHEKIPR